MTITWNCYVTDAYELPCRWWELNLGPLEVQPIALIDDLALDGSSQSLQKVGKWMGGKGLKNISKPISSSSFW